MYTVEIWTNKSWEIVKQTEVFEHALAEYITRHNHDPFGVRLTCEPVYH